MSFREPEIKGAGDARRVAGRWLHALLLEDWTLKLFALAITLGLWFAVTGQRAPAAMRLRGVHLEFLRPDDIEISNEPLSEVEVTVEGSQGRLNDINMRNLAARADIRNLKPGDRVAQLTPQNVMMDLPDGIRIVRIEPRSVALRLERGVERELEVEARFEGRVPEGYEVRGVQVTPGRVRVSGPESHVAALGKTYTETISLEGQRETLTLPQTAVDIADRKVVPLDPVVAVRVEIAERQSERRFTNVPVVSASGETVLPASAEAVVVRGPRSVVGSLRPEDLRLVVERRPDGSAAPRLPPALDARVELVSTTPSEFFIEK